MKSPTIVAAALSLAFATSMAHAGPLTLRLDDDSDPTSPDIEVVDGGLGDLNPVTGAITYQALNYNNYQLLVEIGQSYPVLGSEASPSLSLNTTATLASGANPTNLYIFLSHNDYLGTGAARVASTLLTPDRTASVDVFAAGSNALFDIGSGPIVSQSLSTPPPDEDVDFGPTPAAPYSLTIRQHLTQTSNLNTLVTVPDGGATLLLLGMGLSAFGWARRRS